MPKAWREDEAPGCFCRVTGARCALLGAFRRRDRRYGRRSMDLARACLPEGGPIEEAAALDQA